LWRWPHYRRRTGLMLHSQGPVSAPDAFLPHGFFTPCHEVALIEDPQVRADWGPRCSTKSPAGVRTSVAYGWHLVAVTNGYTKVTSGRALARDGYGARTGSPIRRRQDIPSSVSCWLRAGDLRLQLDTPSDSWLLAVTHGFQAGGTGAGSEVRG